MIAVTLKMAAVALGGRKLARVVGGGAGEGGGGRGEPFPPPPPLPPRSTPQADLLIFRDP